jgi:hypothetical protein
MQVGLATNVLKDNFAFQRASYGFTVFSILGPLVFCLISFIVFMVFFLENLFRQLKYVKTRFATYDWQRQTVQQP